MTSVHAKYNFITDALYKIESYSSNMKEDGQWIQYKQDVLLMIRKKLHESVGKKRFDHTTSFTECGK